MNRGTLDKWNRLQFNAYGEGKQTAKVEKETEARPRRFTDEELTTAINNIHIQENDE